ncbi:flagellar assembly protein FliW [soil metagenome]
MPTSTRNSSVSHDAQQGAPLFGALDIPVDQQVNLSDGLIGFPACHSFALLPAGRRGFTWLRSLEHETLALLLVDPFLYFPGYAIDLPPFMLASLRTTEAIDVSVQAVVTLGDASRGATANLQAPLVFNVRERCGYQYVCQNSPWGIREPIVPESLVAI